MTDAWFPPHAVLEPHTHDRAIFAVMLAGSFTTRIVGREQECTPTSFWTEPLGEKHANRGGAAGARVFVVQPDPQREDQFRPFAALLDGVHHRRHTDVALYARRALMEIAQPDPLAPLAIDCSVFSMLIAATRGDRELTRHTPPPRWALHAREYVHEHYRTGFSLGELADLVGVETSRMAQGFRRYFGRSVGEYARSLRLAWALQQLEGSDQPIAAIALAAGYCDQSHLTREVTRALGMGPAAYRRRTRLSGLPT